MRRIISLVLILVTLVLFMGSCSLLPEEITTCTVNFFVDGKLYQTKTVIAGNTLTPPNAPTIKNEIFVGWKIVGILNQNFDFSKPVVTNMNLQASYVIDAVAATNMVTKNSIKSIVTIENKCYNSTGGIFIESSSEIAQGSGVVIDISGGYCYVLTNYHVVEKFNGFKNQSFEIEDPWGNKYEAELYRKSVSIGYAMDEEYDLALLYFVYNPVNETALEEITFGKNPDVSDYIIALGTPQGLQNTISYGSVVEYSKVNVNDSSSLQKIKFDTIVHNAHIDHGSSGGALLNTSGELVGINFAGYGNGDYGCSIPIEKVREFLNRYVY